MDANQFSSGVASLFALIGTLTEAVEKDNNLLGSLTLEDYQLFSGIVKEYSWVKG